METTINETVPVTPVEKKTRTPKAKVEANGLVLTFSFAHGVDVVVDCATFSEPIKERGLAHGVEQKLRDCYAGAESADEAHGLFMKTLDSLRAGNWNQKGDGTGEETSIERLSLAVRNWLATFNWEQSRIDAVVNSIPSATKAERAALRAKPGVAIELAKMRTEKAVAIGGIELP